MVGHIVGSVDESAEDNWRVTVSQQLAQLRGQRGQLAIMLRTGEFGGPACKRQETPAFSALLCRSVGFGCVDHRTRCGINPLQRLLIAAVQYSGPSQSIDLGFVLEFRDLGTSAECR